MTQRSNEAGAWVQLWKISALWIRRALTRVVESYRNEAADAYLLRPRCCRNEQFREIP